MDQLGGKVNFSSGGFALWLHEFAAVECSTDMKVTLQ
jgi:hypothetical protein